MTAQPIEKRDFIRVPFSTEVDVRVQGRTIRSREGINISMSGIHLTTADTIPPAGTPCQVKIILEMSGSRIVIEASGKMVRSHPGNVAIEFIELDLDSYHHLRRLIVSNADDPERAENEFSAHWGIRTPITSTSG